VELAAALIGAGVLLGKPRRRYAIALVAFLLTVSAAQSAFFVEGRHRLAMMPALLVLSAAGAAAVARSLRNSRVAARASRAVGNARA
jgi:uncharacterized membrane protein YhhN